MRLGAACVLLASCSCLAIGAGGASAQELRGPKSDAAAPGELIVKFRAAGAAARGRALRLAGANAGKPLPIAGMRLVRVDRGQGLGAAIEALEASPAVAYAEPNYVRSLRAAPADPRWPDQWGMRSIAAPAAWDQVTGSRSVTVAVADDGVDLAHEDLAANIWQNPGENGAGSRDDGVDSDGNGYRDDWRGWDFAGADNLPAPEGAGSGLAGRHGTHVAGILGAGGANGIGIAGINWRVGIMPLRIFGRDGRTTTARIVKAFAYAGRNRVAALNASFGGDTGSQAEREAIAAWPQTLFVVAAPNERVNIDRASDYPCGYELPNIICVTASDRSGRVAGFAAYGRETVDLAAPGAAILSTVPGGYAEFTGTSMSAPHVAGAVGLVAAANPALRAAKIKSLLLGSSDRAGGAAIAAGRLNLGRAVAQALAAGSGPEEKAQGRRPKTRITSGPREGISLRSRARFEFSSNIGSARFRCRVDRRRWRACSSPYRTPRLAGGRFHTFRVRAVVPGGKRDRSPAKKRFYVL